MIINHQRILMVTLSYSVQASERALVTCTASIFKRRLGDTTYAPWWRNTRTKRVDQSWLQYYWTWVSILSPQLSLYIFMPELTPRMKSSGNGNTLRKIGYPEHRMNSPFISWAWNGKEKRIWSGSSQVDLHLLMTSACYPHSFTHHISLSKIYRILVGVL